MVESSVKIKEPGDSNKDLLSYANSGKEAEGVVQVSQTGVPVPTGTAADPKFVDVSKSGVGTPTTVNATALGNTTLVTPAAGKKVRLKVFIMTNNGAAVVQAGLRFAAAGTIHFNGDLAADGGARALNLLGAYIEGAADQALIINLSAAGNVHVTTITEEV